MNVKIQILNIQVTPPLVLYCIQIYLTNEKDNWCIDDVGHVDGVW